MALTLSPNTSQTAVVNHPICFDGSGIVSIPGQANPIPLTLETSGTGWNYNPTSEVFIMTQTDLTGLTRAPGDHIAYGLQPFWIRMANTAFTTPGAPNNNSHCFIGITGDNGAEFIFQVMKYCNSNTSTCGAVGGSNWVINIGTPYSVYVRNVNFNEQFFIRSDGINIIFEHIQGGVYITDYVYPLPQSNSWNFYVGGLYNNNQVSMVATWTGTYQGTVPITWSAPLGGTLTGTSSRQCFTADVPGSYQVCIDSDFDDPLCVDITVDDLTLGVVGLNCGECVFTGTTVHFESNGGLDGTLTVLDDEDNPAGTIIDALTWQAPGVPVHVTATYTLGTYAKTCELNVVPQFKVLNVIGDTITGLIPGDTFQLRTNYDFPDEDGFPVGIVRWSNLSCDNLVSPDGLITIPKYYRNECFGMTDCSVRATIIQVPGATCPNLIEGGSSEIYFDVNIKINPVYPTPDFGGPIWNKWKPETPDFRVISKTMEGGCSETYIRNKVPVMRWTVNYSGLPHVDENLCPVACCDDVIGFVGGFDPRFQTAKMIDDFWMLVGGQYGYFTLVDPRTGEVWQNVRFENNLERDHINWKRIQSRTVSLIWNPCCATYPMGATCAHRTIIRDNIAPTTPQDLEAVTVSFSRIDLTWSASIDNVGVYYYELEIDGVAKNIGNVLFYKNIGLHASSSHHYRVRAVDFDNNPSEWSDYVVADTLSSDNEYVLEGDNFVKEDTAFVIESGIEVP